MNLRTGIIFLVCLLSCLVLHAQELPTGKYVFSAPALFGSAGGEARGQICELEITEDGCQLELQNNPLSRKARVTFSVENGNIQIDRSHLSSSEISRVVMGNGRMIDGETASGELTLTSSVMGYLQQEKKSSAWSLRPATEAEVYGSYLEGLKLVEDYLWVNRAIEKPNRENAIKALRAAVGYGFSRKDVSELERMMESGELKYENRRFVFPQLKIEEEEPIAVPISTNVVTEYIDLRPAPNTQGQSKTQTVATATVPLSPQKSLADPVSTNKPRPNPPALDTEDSLREKESKVEKAEGRSTLLHTLTILCFVLIFVYLLYLKLRVKDKR